MRCCSCGNPIGSLKARRRRLKFNSQPFRPGEERYCDQCAHELFRSRFLPRRSRRIRGGRGIGDTNPGQENATREMEG
jgi:ribosomal protein L34E